MYMSIKYGFFFILLMFFCSSEAFSEENFSWEMFIPATTNPCRPDNLPFCNNQDNCEAKGGYWYQDSCHSEPEPTCSTTRLDLCTSELTCITAGGYWYDQSCHADPEELTCDINYLELCFTEETCISAGGYWYELNCHQNQSANFINTEKLAGDWFFRIFTASWGTFTRQYILDKNTIKEDPVGSGKFTIKGTDSNMDPVTGAYVPLNNNYTMYLSKTEFDILYEFTFMSTSDVSGCYFEVDKTDGTRSSCMTMVGAK